MDKATQGFLLALVCREHGHKAVRFALNVPDDQAMTEIQWTEGRRQALQVLIGGVMIADLSRERRTKQFRNAVHGYWAHSGDSIMRTLRVTSGGDLPSVDAGVDDSQDAAVRRLMRLVNRYELDIQVLAERENSWRRCPSILGDHDGAAMLAELLSRDELEPLRVALGSDQPGGGPRACTVIVPTTVTHLYEAMVPEHLLEACASRALVHGQPLSADSMRGHAAEVIQDFVALVSGRAVNVPMAVGAVGSRLLPSHGQPRGLLEHVEESDMIAVGDGYLRPTTRMDQRLFTMAKEQIGLVWVTQEETRMDIRPLCDAGVSSGEEELMRVWRDMLADLVPSGSVGALCRRRSF